MGAPVAIGVSLFATDRTIPPARLAVEAEARGFASIWVPEHTHIPVARTTPAPTGGDLAEGYRRTLDPFIALATAAEATSTIALGTGVSLPAEHDPIALAKAIATLDHLSSGRVRLGVGYGWNREELADHGVAFRERRAVVRERVLAMQSLWRDDEASFTGDHITLSPSWAWPKPARQPGPPVLLGGDAGPRLFAHIAEYGGGWIPFGSSGLTDALPRLSQAVDAAGRDPGEIEVVPFGVIPDPGKFEHFATLGISHCVIALPAEDPDETLRALDDAARHLDG